MVELTRDVKTSLNNVKTSLNNWQVARRGLNPRSRSDNNPPQQYPLVTYRINVLLARNPLTCKNASLAELTRTSTSAEPTLRARPRCRCYEEENWLPSTRTTNVRSFPIGPIFCSAINKTPAIPIAISGMAYRLPGGIDSPDLLWQSASGCGTSVPCFYARAYDPISGLATRRYGGHRHGLLFKGESRSTRSNDRLRQVWRWVKG
jgi:hypothetical protein